MQQDSQLNILPPAPKDTADIEVVTTIDTATIETQTDPEEMKLTYAEATNKPNTSKPNTLLLYPNKDSEEMNLVKFLKIGSDFQIKDVRKLQTVDCPSQQDVDKILGRIGNNPSLQEKIKPIRIKKHLTKCIVFGLEPEFTKEQMEASLSQSFGGVHEDLKVLFPIKGRTALKIQTEQGPLAVISAYSSPYNNIMETLQELDCILTNLGDGRFLIYPDLNAYSRAWGYDNEDTRGAQVEDFLLAQQFCLLNETNSPHKFEHCGRK
ncbi:hypothetical protein AVEN_74087-1 [Araneus ventricosus]|uniref:Endonuclease/exonuclease/phosphatase domain-containing protein n=1 Tax=Araneus ventricosus TaxID=182803 RepID=A0A4Y2U5A7_ARAVE|nr:hypothetical protein AVEN_74087-1 [Araneus ventricosus]